MNLVEGAVHELILVKSVVYVRESVVGLDVVAVGELQVLGNTGLFWGQEGAHRDHLSEPATKSVALEETVA